MDFLGKWLDRFKLRPYRKLLKQINGLKDHMAALSDGDLQGQTQLFKERLESGERLEQMIPEVYATIREASMRVLGKFPYDVQVLGALVLNDGNIAEMKTGEGKTLTAVMPLYLNALTGKSAILVTASSYLAKRDAAEMGELFNWMGLRVGVPLPAEDEADLPMDQKRYAYEADIIYTTHSDLGFDYLREKIITSAQERFLPAFNYILIDEVDSILLDAAQTPLIISGNQASSTKLAYSCNDFVTMLRPQEHYMHDKKKVGVWLTREGVDAAERYFRLDNLYAPQNHQLVKALALALQAHVLYQRDKQYMVRNGEVLLIDEASGRVMNGSKLSAGVHQAIEVKEGVEMTEQNSAVASITYQNLYRLFPKLSGMTGTGKVSYREFRDIYDLAVISIPTNKPNQRIDYADEIFLTEWDKQVAVLRYVQRLHATGQPILLATGSVQQSEKYSRLLLHHKISHNLLNAYSLPKEAEMIKLAGQYGAVTIATPLAGRGTDILLDQKVIDVGGLAVVGTERMASERIDLQLRGRSGRQGAPGHSQFFLSLEDPLIKNSRYKPLERHLKKLKKEKEKKITNGRVTTPRLRALVKQAQQQGEYAGEQARSRVFSYDESVRIQRQYIYGQRDYILDAKDFSSDYFYAIIKKIILNIMEKSGDFSKKTFTEFAVDYFGSVPALPDFTISKKTLEETIAYLHAYFMANLADKEAKIGHKGQFMEFQRRVMLNALDESWIAQLDYLQQLQRLLGERQYEQKNPVYEFHKEAYASFALMQDKMDKATLRGIMTSYIGEDSQGRRKVLF